MKQNGDVHLSCRKAPPGEDGYVVYCDLSAICRRLEYGTRGAENIMQLYDKAAPLGSPQQNGNLVVPSKTLAEHIYGPLMFERIQENIIGRALSSGANYDYINVIDAAAHFAAEGKYTLSEDQAAAVRHLEELSQRSDAESAPPPQGLPKEWPNWMGVASELQPHHLTDEKSPFPESNRQPQPSKPEFNNVSTFSRPPQESSEKAGADLQYHPISFPLFLWRQTISHLTFLYNASRSWLYGIFARP